MTAVLITLATFALLVTWDRRVPLMMAHYFWGPTMLLGGGAKLKIEGQEHVDFSKPHVFLMNHQSTLDIPIIFAVVPVPLRFIVKKELMYAPFVGFYIWAMGMIFVDRKNRTKAIASLKRAGQIIREGASIIAYPEGTRSGDGSILSFKKGTFMVAIESGVPIVPVAVEGSRHVMPKDELLNLTPGEVRVKLGQPIATQGYQKETLPELMDKVRQAVIDLHIEIGGKGACEAIKVQDQKSKVA